MSSAWPDLSDSTNKSAAMKKAEMSRQSFGAWQGFTTSMEQPGIPQGGNVPKGELLSGDTMALWDGVGVLTLGQLRVCLQLCCPHGLSCVGFPRFVAAETGGLLLHGHS